MDAGEFLRMITSTGLDSDVNNGNYTILVPLDKALKNFAEDMSVLVSWTLQNYLLWKNCNMNCKCCFVQNQVDVARRRRDLHNALSTKDLVMNHMIEGFVDLSEVENEQTYNR